MPHPRLTDLGVTTPSTSNARLTRLFGGDIEQTQNDIAQVQATKTPGTTDILKSTRGLIPALASLALIAGGEEGAGIGGLLGTVFGAEDKANQFVTAKNSQIEDLQGQLEKSQQRLATMIQTSPGVFVDDEGQAIAQPEEFGRWLGLPVAVDPGANIRRSMISDSQDEVLKTLDTTMDAAIANNDEDAILSNMKQKMRVLGQDFDDTVLVDLISTDPTKLLGNMIPHFTPLSMGRALEESEATGKPMWHSSVFKLLETEGSQTRIPVAEKLWDQSQEALAIHSAFLVDPANEAFLSRGFDVSFPAAITAAGKTELLDAYRKTYNIPDPSVLSDKVIGPMLMQASKFTTMIAGAQGINMSAEERKVLFGGLVDDMVQSITDGQQINTGVAIGDAMRRIRLAIDKNQPDWTEAQKSKAVKDALNVLLADTEGAGTAEFNTKTNEEINKIEGK